MAGSHQFGLPRRLAAVAVQQGDRHVVAPPTDVLFAFGSTTLSSSAAEVLGTLRERVAVRGRRVIIQDNPDGRRRNRRVTVVIGR